MKINFKINSSDEKQIIHFKNYLEHCGIDELENIEILRKPTKAGEMGPGGFLSEITSMISNIGLSLSRLTEALVKYVESYKTEIVLKNEKGEELLLNTRRLDKKGIQDLVKAFFEKSQKGKSSIEIKEIKKKK